MIVMTHRVSGSEIRVNDDEQAAVWEGYGYRRGDSPPVPAVDDRFDPGKWNVDDVTAYLADADDAERARVLEAEAAGKARKSIAKWEPAPADDD